MSRLSPIVVRALSAFVFLPLAMLAQEKGPSVAEKKNCWLRDANSPAGSTAYLLCEQGQIWVTTDAGGSWTQRATGATSALRAFSWIDTNRGIAIGDKGVILATDDAGKTWQPRKAPGTDRLADIFFLGDLGWIAGYRGTILHSTDGGKTWASQKTDTTLTLESIYFVDKDHGWAAGWSGTILRTTDGGNTWHNVKYAASSWTLFAIYFRDDNNGWVTGFAGQILHTTDGGLTWTAQTSPIKSSLYSVTFDKSNRGWITYDEGFLISDDNGATWKDQRAGRYFLGKILPVGQALWAVGQSTVLQRAANGQDWKKIDTLVAGRSFGDVQNTGKQR